VDDEDWQIPDQQYLRVADASFCRATASTIVAGKIRNLIAMSRRQRRLREEGRSPVAELEAILPRVRPAQTLESLNGFEGAASAAYFRSFRAALKEDWNFTARVYHPPTDPVNALLSLGYTLHFCEACYQRNEATRASRQTSDPKAVIL
jgi:CRISP-associated protein Cas1